MSTKKKGLQDKGEPLTPEKRSEAITRSILGLDRSELADVYRSETLDDPTQKLYDLAVIAENEYRGRGELSSTLGS